MPAGRAVSNLPLGPSTNTVLPSILTVTPLGIGIGFFPIRGIRSALAFLPLVPSLFDLTPALLAARSLVARKGSLPNLAQQLAAHSVRSGLASGHPSARRGEDIDPH